MKRLFVHQNFPGQFAHLAPALAARGDQVASLSVNKPPLIKGVASFTATLSYRNGAEHPWVRDFESKVVRADAAFRAARDLRDKGFDPDTIIAHPGWGEAMFLKEVWPKARLGLYCEYYYHAIGGDIDFDPEFFGGDIEVEGARARVKNLAFQAQLDQGDGFIAPTHYQASTFPAELRSLITVVHDGIDTAALRPSTDARIKLASGVTLTRQSEVITYVSRGLEPARGFHVFMRALPEILRRRPRARAIIVGADKSAYGPMPDHGTWRDRMMAEVGNDLDMSRVHFLGRIPYAQYVALLQISTVHLYLTYPFVLSWSLLEAMSLGAAIVASDTPPVREAIRDGETGRLVDFFDVAALADQVCDLIRHPRERARLGANARKHALARYDLRTQCLPRQIDWVDRLHA